MTLPGNAAIPASDSRRLAMAEMAGRRAVEMAIAGGPKPSQILTAQAFDNAIRADMAIGGSTNAIIHLVAIAGRVGVALPLTRFDELSKTTPFLVNLRPSGKYLMEDFFYAGGLPAVLKQLLPLLHGGRADRERPLDRRQRHATRSASTRTSFDPLAMPLSSEGGTVILVRQSLPRRRRAQAVGGLTASPDASRPRGRRSRTTRISTSASTTRASRSTRTRCWCSSRSARAGRRACRSGARRRSPRGFSSEGVKDMVRISDARMSGTSYGTVVLHVAPESAIGGPLALVRDGDEIELDVPRRSLTPQGRR